MGRCARPFVCLKGEKTMRKHLKTIAVAAGLAGLAFSAGAADGTFTGRAMGHNDEVAVNVTVKDGRIAAIDVVKHHETPGVSDRPLKVIPKAVVDRQTLRVDRVSGATFSSLAIVSAIRDAMKKAGLNPSDFMTGDPVRHSAPVPEHPSGDVVIVGGGGAGVSAAVSAARAGAKVVLIEKSSFIGGNTVLAGGALNAANPPLQVKQKMSAGQRKMVEELLSEKPRSALHGELIEKTRAVGRMDRQNARRAF